MKIPVTLIHWGGGTKSCDEARLSANGKRVEVHFAAGHWLEFLLDTGLLVGKRKADVLDAGKGRLSTWRLPKNALAHFRAEAARAKKPAAGAEVSP